MVLSQAILSSAAVGVGCGAGCGSSAFAFLSAYILAQGKGFAAALGHAGAFLAGKLSVVTVLCLGSAVLGAALLEQTGGAALHRLFYGVLLLSALWLLWEWRRGCRACTHCRHTGEKLPSFAVGVAYGLSPCAPLLMVLGYAALLTPPEAVLLGTAFTLASSLVPVVLTLAVSGTLSGHIAVQLGRTLVWFRLAVYLFFLCAAVYGLAAGGGM